jgi:hypothetical protein
MHITQSAKSIALIIVIASSFAGLPVQLLNGLPSILTIPLTTLQLFEYAYGQTIFAINKLGLKSLDLPHKAKPTNTPRVALDSTSLGFGFYVSC